MKNYYDSTYGDRIAEVYDEQYGEYDPAMIDFLHDFAGGGPVLELGIGTGRVAIQLQERGISVQGIDASEAMVAKMREKPGGKKIEVQIGSFTQFELEQKFQLVYVVFNTFFALLTQDEQLSCFQSVSRHLASGGAFVLEAFVPDLARFENHQTVRAVDLTEDIVRMDISRHDPVTQQISSQHVFLTEEGTKLYPVKLRYVWPSEMDLMARLAGLELKHRWSSWTKTEYSKDSGKHISVYGK
jgi:SAM-dependent methyltransferase